MKRLLLTTVLAFVIQLGYSQGIQMTYGTTGNEYMYKVKHTPDSGFIFFGQSSVGGMGGTVNAFFVKADRDGNMVWDNSLDNGGSDRMYAGTSTNDGGFASVGRSTSFSLPENSHYVVKLDGSGNLIWSATYSYATDDIRPEGMIETADNGFVIVGYTGCTQGGSCGDNYAHVMKISSTGDIVFDRLLGKAGESDIARGVIQASNGDFVVVGHTSSYDSASAWIQLTRMDVTGTVLWSKVYGGAGYDRGWAVRETADGGLIVAGETDTYGSGDNDIILIRTDATGTVIWSKAYGNVDAEEGYSVEETADGGFAVTGEMNVGGDNDFFLIKTDNAGDTAWTKVYGGGGNDNGRGLLLLDSGYAMSGYTTSFGAGGVDFMLLTTDLNGVLGSCYENYAPIIITDLTGTLLSASITQGITSSGPKVTQISTVGGSTATANSLLLDITTFTNPSSTGNNGSAIATVTGGVPPYDYLWNDAAAQTTAIATGLAPGTYNVSVTDNAGCVDQKVVDISDVSGIIDLDASENWTLYPNPSNGQVKLIFSDASKATISVYNSVGKMVYTGESNSIIKELDLGSLTSGLYVVQISSNGLLSHKKLLIE